MPSKPSPRPQKLDEYVADALREQVLAGVRKPGDRLVEATLAEELGVSAGTVRAGFRILRNEGLVTYELNRGVSVSVMTDSDAYEIYSLRNYLEALAARLAAERLTESGARTLEQAMGTLRRAVRAGSRADVIRADMDLHLAIVACSGHRRLCEMYGGIGNQSILFMNLTEGFHRNRDEIAEIHESLVDAILDRDGARAEGLALEHNTTDGETLRKMLEPVGAR